MKKKIFYTVLAVMFCGLFFVMYTFISGKSMFAEKSKSSFNAASQVDNDEYTTFYVGKGTIKDIYIAKGIIAANGDNQVVEALEYDNRNKLKLNKNLGEKFTAGELLYTLNGKEHKSTFNGKLTNAVLGDNSASLYYENFNTYYVETHIRDIDEKSVKHDTEILVKYNDKSYNGKLVFINNRLDENGLLVKVKIDSDLVLGSKVDVQFIKGIKENVLTLSSKAIEEENKNFFVTVVNEDGTHCRVPVKLGYSDGEGCEIISSDLAEGQKIVKRSSLLNMK